MLGLTALFALAAGAAWAQEHRYVVTVAPARPQHGFEKLSISRATVGSNPIVVWANAAINPDCSAVVPGATLAILSPPSHGQATVSDEPAYISFPPDNPRSACNDRKVPAHQVIYTAAAGFTGHDHLMLRGTSPEGWVRQISVDVDVR